MRGATGFVNPDKIGTYGMGVYGTNSAFKSCHCMEKQSALLDFAIPGVGKAEINWIVWPGMKNKG